VPSPAEDAVARMRSRAKVMRFAFVVLLAAGLVGSIIAGVQAGKSINFHTFVFTSSSKDNSARGVAVFLIGLLATVITTAPLLGIAWIIDGQADLAERRPGGN
jgi:hypothetical protein